MYICSEIHVMLFQTQTHVIQTHVPMDDVSQLVLVTDASVILVTRAPLVQVMLVINTPQHININITR